ncbi:MAG: hypothetical protein D6678_02565 [Zetaproteobacteria bacterium]|nr:MAG: hypothetical protein D6678_02565 [Zetaproteobacteria bacterium]
MSYRRRRNARHLTAAFGLSFLAAASYFLFAYLLPQLFGDPTVRQDVVGRTTNELLDMAVRTLQEMAPLIAGVLLFFALIALLLYFLDR